MCYACAKEATDIATYKDGNELPLCGDCPVPNALDGHPRIDVMTLAEHDFKPETVHEVWCRDGDTWVKNDRDFVLLGDALIFAATSIQNGYPAKVLEVRKRTLVVLHEPGIPVGKDDLFFPHVLDVEWVRFRHPDAGTEHDSEIAKKHLQYMKVYQVEKVLEYSWYTNLYLIDFPGIQFNLVNFEVVHEPSENQQSPGD